VDPPPCLGLGYPLHPVDAAFVFQAAVRAAARNKEADLPVAAELGLVDADHLGPIAFRRGVHGIHAVEAARKQGGFLPTRAGSDLHDHAAFIVRVTGQEPDFELLGKGLAPFPAFRKLLLGELPQLLIQTAFIEQGFGFPYPLFRLFILPVGVHQRGQPAALLEQAPVVLRISGHTGVTQAVGDFLKPPLHLFELFKHRSSSLPSVCRQRKRASRVLPADARFCGYAVRFSAGEPASRARSLRI